MSKIEKYAEVRQQINNLETIKKELEADVIAELMELGKKSEDTTLGKVTMVERKSYTYSPKVAKAEEKFKKEEAKLKDQIKSIKEPVDILKFQEEKSGVAKVEITNSVSFKPCSDQ